MQNYLSYRWHLYPFPFCPYCWHPLPCRENSEPDTSTHSLWSQRSVQETPPPHALYGRCYQEHFSVESLQRATTWHKCVSEYHQFCTIIFCTIIGENAQTCSGPLSPKECPCNGASFLLDSRYRTSFPGACQLSDTHGERQQGKIHSRADFLLKK